MATKESHLTEEKLARRRKERKARGAAVDPDHPFPQEGEASADDTPEGGG